MYKFWPASPFYLRSTKRKTLNIVQQSMLMVTDASNHTDPAKATAMEAEEDIPQKQISCFFTFCLQYFTSDVDILGGSQVEYINHNTVGCVQKTEMFYQFPPQSQTKYHVGPCNPHPPNCGASRRSCNCMTV